MPIYPIFLFWILMSWIFRSRSSHALWPQIYIFWYDLIITNWPYYPDYFFIGQVPPSDLNVVNPRYLCHIDHACNLDHISTNSIARWRLLQSPGGACCFCWTNTRDRWHMKYGCVLPGHITIGCFVNIWSHHITLNITYRPFVWHKCECCTK